MAKRGNRVARPKADLERELREQIELLTDACDRYDSGKEVVGRHIALSLRVLLNQHGKNHALLEQLGIRAGKWLDTAGPLSPTNLMAEHNLVALKAGPDGGRYVPASSLGDGLPNWQADFPDWWTRPVMKDTKGRTMSRFELVGHVANSDGGAHVDPELDEAYMALSRQNALGWTFEHNGNSTPFSSRPEFASVRQIAHEVIETLKLRAPQYFSGT